MLIMGTRRSVRILYSKDPSYVIEQHRYSPLTGITNISHHQVSTSGTGSWENPMADILIIDSYVPNKIEG